MLHNLFIDFDGTLIDSRWRQYQLFCELLPTCALTFDDYWQIKRQRVSQAEMLKKYWAADEDSITAFHLNWLSKIEELNRLKLDTPMNGMGGILRNLSDKFSLCLVTARQNTPNVLEQLHWFQWQSFFTKVLVTEQRNSKADLIRQSMSFRTTDIFVGDTGEDVIAGKSLGMRTIAVSYGVLAENILETYSPDLIVKSPKELSKYLNEHTNCFGNEEASFKNFIC